jgi:hypothetical protein
MHFRWKEAIQQSKINTPKGDIKASALEFVARGLYYDVNIC